MSNESDQTSCPVSTNRRQGRHQQRLNFLLWGVLGGILIGVMGLGIWSLIHPKAVSLPVYGTVPEFSLLDQRHRTRGRSDFVGKIWIVNFIYTNCADECPLMTAEMAQFQSALAGMPELRLVSITVDPEHDTPEVLSRYAARFDADPERWFFLTGDKSAIYRLAREGFKLGIVDPSEGSTSRSRQEHPPNLSNTALTRCTLGPPEAPRRQQGWWRYLLPAYAFADHGRALDPLHSRRFVLVDPNSQIRGYYDSQDEAALQRLCQHLQLLRQDF